MDCAVFRVYRQRHTKQKSPTEVKKSPHVLVFYILFLFTPKMVRADSCSSWSLVLPSYPHQVNAHTALFDHNSSFYCRTLPNSLKCLEVT